MYTIIDRDHVLYLCQIHALSGNSNWTTKSKVVVNILAIPFIFNWLSVSSDLPGEFLRKLLGTLKHARAICQVGGPAISISCHASAAINSISCDARAAVSSICFHACVGSLLVIETIPRSIGKRGESPLKGLSGQIKQGSRVISIYRF
jgi:hypothetical protein